MKSISAQLVSCAHKKSNSSISLSIENAGFLCTTFLHLLYGIVKNLNTRVQINKIKWIAWFFVKIYLEM